MSDTKEETLTWEQFKANVQKVLDTPGYDPKAMAKATMPSWKFGMSLQMGQDVRAYWHTHNNTNGKTFEYNWD
ncbi:MAG: hypothetical protein ACRYFX_18800 [Janthinobacterium lividum]